MFPSWLKTALIVAAVVAVIVVVVFLWLLVAGADASRRRRSLSETGKMTSESSQNEKRGISHE